MNELEGVRSWLVRIQTLTTLIMEQQNAIDDLSVRKHYALQDDNKRLWAKLDAKFKAEYRVLELLLGDLTRWTGCITVHDVTELIADIKARVSQAFSAYERWREVLALIEHVDALKEFTDESREEATAKARKQRKEYEVVVDSVWRIIPMDSELMLI